MRFDVEATCHDDVAVVTAYGELDISTVPQLAARVRAALQHAPRRLVMDLTPLTFIDSTGCQLLIDTKQDHEGPGREVVIVCPPTAREAHRVLDLLGLIGPLQVQERYLGP